MTPFLRTKNSSAPLGDASTGDERAARATAFQVFTKHESRDTKHGLYRRSGRRGCARAEKKVATQKPPPGHCFPVPVRAAWRGMARLGGAPSGCPRTVRAGNTAFQVFTKHETRNTAFVAVRFAVGAPCGEKKELKVPEPKTEIRRPHRRARRHITTSLRMLMGPFLKILVFSRLIAVFTESLRVNNPQFPTIPRNSLDTYPPRAGVPAPSAVLARLPGARPPPQQKRPSFVVIRVHSW